MLIGTGIMFACEEVVSRVLEKRGLKLPSSLISMLAIFVFLNGYAAAAGEETAEKAAEYLRPAVDHLGKWMPLYLAPPLVALPNALKGIGSDSSASMWAKLGCIHAAGWLFTLVSTAAIAKKVQQYSHPSNDTTTVATDNAPADADETEPVSADAAVDETVAAAADDVADTASTATTTSAAKAVKSKDDKMKEAWTAIAAASFILAPVYGSTPATFSTTVLSLLHGNALPKRIKDVIHPLVTCSVVTGVVAVVFGRCCGLTSQQALDHYFNKKGMLKGGAGDVYYGLLSTCCCALGVRMFYSRRILAENLVPLVISTAASTVLSLFGTTAVCGAAKLPPTLTLTLAQRSVMSSLGIPAAALLGGIPAVAVASILLTGVYGASFGRSILDEIGITTEQKVTRGIATGASAHSIGTSSLMESEPDAAAISSVSLCLAGIFHTALCSVPAVQHVLKKLAHAI
jgi:putative effector of murein hydrolase